MWVVKEPFASVGDVAAEFPRPLTPSEEKRAESLVLVASRLLETNVKTHIATMEEHELARIVVVDMVATALLPGEYRGHQSYSWRNGSLAGSGTLVADAAGGIRLLDWHLAMFGGSVRAMPKGTFPKPQRWPE
ncbi:hypothetical protein NCCP2495_05460 [Dietzia sp. NCCP-2495]|uniref:phage Gp19/Gp15/Gp42 family protein n=1 Tax=Dietzia sp. NCCP-2495 TaxID=2934675 RepID=UPI002232567F|nr:phage Gp19/Gp15/Gp42 family protein [Dietzia sp. NCCP-2495]GLB62668.1 hypothetical protein NCCP2495_05460 [Dietzia sp. NCCP-2495]